MTKVEQELWDRVARYLPRLRWIPFVRMVAVCNSLAFGKVHEGSDIDLFVVTRRGRMFTVRFLMMIVLQFYGVRLHGKKIAKRFCLSFFVDERSLNLAPIAIEDDYYLALWCTKILPIIDDGISGDFLSLNGWIWPYVERSNLDLSGVIGAGEQSSFWKGLLAGRFGDLVEWILRKWMMGRALRKLRAKGEAGWGEVVSESMLKFHENDRRREFKGERLKAKGERRKAKGKRKRKRVKGEG